VSRSSRRSAALIVFATVVVAALVAAAMLLIGSDDPKNGKRAPRRAVPTGVPADPCRGSSPKSWAHVVVIVLENRSYSDIVHASPYLNELAAECGLATNSWAITHPSLPNYIAMTSGGTKAFAGTDCTAGPTCDTTADSIFSQLGADWKVYAEGMTENCQRKDDPPRHYVVHHNPPPYYTQLSFTCEAQDEPFSRNGRGFPADLDSGRLPRFAMIVPDLLHDEHDGSILEGDAWLQTWVPKILGTRAYARGSTAVFVVYDEGTYLEPTDTPSQVYTVVVSPSTMPGTRSDRYFNHYSLLRTWQEMLDLGCLGNSCSAESMTSAFHL
jgi:phosphatidylinositol-3-phosphatase